MSELDVTGFLDRAEAMLRKELGSYPSFALWRGLYGHEIINRTFETVVVGLSDDKSGENPPDIILLLVYASPDTNNTQVHLEEDAGHGENHWTGGMGGIGELTGVWEATRYLHFFFEQPAPQ